MGLQKPPDPTMNSERIAALNAAYRYLTAKKAHNKANTLVLGRNVVFWLNPKKTKNHV
jgi:hypothetical protein